MVCCPSRVSLCRCSSQKLILGNRCDGASELSGRAGSGGMAGAWAHMTIAHPILLPHEGEPVGCGFRAPENPSKAAGPREPGQLSPGSPYGERRAGGENGLRCFLDPRRVRAVVGCPRRVFLCRMQLPVARLGPSVQRGLGTVLPSRLMGHGWGLGAEGLPAPYPASPRRRTSGKWVSGTGDPQQSSRAQGAGAAQPRFALWRAEGRGRKRLALLSRSEACWGCGLLPEESFPLQNAAARSSFGPSVRRSLGAERPSWLRRHGWGLGAEGLRAPNPASPRRRTRGDCVSSA